MRTLIIEPGPSFSVIDVCRGWTAGLRQMGCETASFNFGDRLDFYAAAHLEKNGEYVRAFSTEEAVHLAAKGIETACYELWPDLIVVISGFFLPVPLYELLRTRGHKVALIHTESPYEDTRQMGRAGLADVNIINDPTHLESFRDVNPKTWYLPAAHDPAVHCPGSADPDLTCDFGFVGTGFESRVRFFESVDWSGLDVGLAGNWSETTAESPLRKFLVHDIAECFPNDRTVGLYRSANMSANLYRREAQAPGLEQGWAMGPREVELAAVGCPFLRESRPEGDEVLPMLPTFEGTGDFEEKLRWWIANEPARHEAATAAQVAVADRTFTKNAGALLRLLA